MQHPYNVALSGLGCGNVQSGTAATLAPGLGDVPVCIFLDRGVASTGGMRHKSRKRQTCYLKQRFASSEIGSVFILNCATKLKGANSGVSPSSNIFIRGVWSRTSGQSAGETALIQQATCRASGPIRPGKGTQVPLPNFT
jgi:hypothetical protein